MKDLIGPNFGNGRLGTCKKIMFVRLENVFTTNTCPVLVVNTFIPLILRI